PPVLVLVLLPSSLVPVLALVLVSPPVVGSPAAPVVVPASLVSPPTLEPLVVTLPVVDAMLPVDVLALAPASRAASSPQAPATAIASKTLRRRVKSGASPRPGRSRPPTATPARSATSSPPHISIPSRHRATVASSPSGPHLFAVHAQQTPTASVWPPMTRPEAACCDTF